MDLKQVQHGSFDPVRAIRLLAGEVAALKGRVARGEGRGEGPNMDAGELGADLAQQPGETTLIVKEGLRGLLNDRLVEVLARGGFATVASIAGARDADLLAVDGVGPVTLREIRELIPGTTK